jgi:hypothetical protein
MFFETQVNDNAASCSWLSLATTNFIPEDGGSMLLRNNHMVCVSHLRYARLAATCITGAQHMMDKKEKKPFIIICNK